jgi:hypothetical protein
MRSPAVGRSMAEIGRFASEARDVYLRHYCEAIDRWSANHDKVVPEVLIELGGPSSALIRKLTRVDIIWGGAERPSVVEVNVDPVPTEHSILRMPGSPEIELFPFVWNACELVFSEPLGLRPDFDLWYDKWMDVADNHEPGDHRLSGVVHSVTVPKQTSACWSFSVDFGSAPVDTLIELLELHSWRPASLIKVGSFSYR